MSTSETASIDLRLLREVCAFASTEETRYYLNGVCLEIEPRFTVYVATDAHRLLAYRDELAADAPDNGLTGRFIIPSFVCKKVKFGKREHHGAITGGVKGMAITSPTAGSGLTFEPIDGTFPDWRCVYPMGDASGKPGQFNLEYLASFQKFARAIDLSGYVTIAHDGAGNPTRIIFSDPTIAACVMPVRSNGMRGVAAWVHAPAPVAAPMQAAA